VAVLTGIRHGIGQFDLARRRCADGSSDTAQTTGVGIGQGNGGRVE
jgi:hypothetical protein